MKYALNTIVSDVETCIDEIASNDSEWDGTQDDSERETIIKSKVIDALRYILANADYSLIEPDINVSSQKISTLGLYRPYASSAIEGREIGLYILPDNFLRLAYAVHPSWTRPLSQQDIILWTDPAYAMLKDPYCTGTDERPKIAINYRTMSIKETLTPTKPVQKDETNKELPEFSGDLNSGDPTPPIRVVEEVKKVLELHTLTTEEPFLIGIVTEPVLDTDNKYTIPEKCYGAVIYYISGMLFVTYGDEARARQMFDTANDLIGLSTPQQPIIQ